MAKRLVHPHSAEIREAVRAFGIDPSHVRSIDLHIDTENIPTITIAFMSRTDETWKISDLLSAVATGPHEMIEDSIPTCDAMYDPTETTCVMPWGHDGPIHRDSIGREWRVTS